MSQKQDIPLSSEEFQRIYIDEAFRNSVAFATGCYTAGNVFSHFCALAYPERYEVTQEQINEAKAQLQKAKREIFEAHSKDLLFVCMGGSYDSRYIDDICNHRIRTEFTNKDGHRYFIEVGTFGEKAMRCDYSVDRDLEIEYDALRQAIYEKIKVVEKRSNDRALLYKQLKDLETNPKYYHKNFGKIESVDLNLTYTKHNLLNLVNDTYDCMFQNIIVDHHTISMSDRDIICYSPKGISDKSVGTHSQQSLF